MMTAREFVEKTGGRLRPLPAALVRLAEILSNPAFSIESASEVIASDPAFAAETLAMANSAASASTRRIEEIPDAVVRLGAPRILAWASARRVGSELQKPQSWYGLEAKDLWKHSLISALAADKLRTWTREHGIVLPGSAYATALLHDIGKTLLGEFLPPARRHQISEYAAAGSPWADAERIVLGFSHADIGAELLERWGLPAEMTEAVKRHHDAEKSEGLLDDVIHIANVVAKFTGVGMGAEGLGLRADPNAASRLALTQKGLEIIALESFLELSRHEKILGGGGPESGEKV